MATLAKKDGRIVGIAGASDDCAKMWQVGVDVLPEFRNFGLAAHLVNRLTLEILKRGFIPYYGTSESHIASQRVAHRAGYYPAWICAYKGKFDGLELSPTS
jgi:predicted GNAT family acetyltransferase